MPFMIQVKGSLQVYVTHSVLIARDFRSWDYSVIEYPSSPSGPTPQDAHGSAEIGAISAPASQRHEDISELESLWLREFLGRIFDPNIAVRSSGLPLEPDGRTQLTAFPKYTNIRTQSRFIPPQRPQPPPHYASEPILPKECAIQAIQDQSASPNRRPTLIHAATRPQLRHLHSTGSIQETIAAEDPLPSPGRLQTLVSDTLNGLSSIANYVPRPRRVELLRQERNEIAEIGRLERRRLSLMLRLRDAGVEDDAWCEDLETRL